MTSFVLTPLPAPLPAPGQMPTTAIVVDEADSYPCRRCLEDATPGETVLLLSYNPFVGESAYSQPGPIFVHQKDCTTIVSDGSALPRQLTRRLLSVRAYDEGHRMVGNAVTPGTDLATTAAGLLDAPGAAYLHVHNAGPGCFAVRLDKA